MKTVQHRTLSDLAEKLIGRFDVTFQLLMHSRACIDISEPTVVAHGWATVVLRVIASNNQ